MTNAAWVLAAVLCWLTPAGDALADPRARVESGVIEGATLEGGVRVFRSIPYAAPPVGPLRWRAPQLPARWRGVRSAREFGPSCVQNISAQGWGPWTGEFSPQGAVSEDCLTLTVWTPSGRRGSRLPVMLWIPGGGFTDGGEATAVSDGAALARRGIVVVSINYRVAAFGLLAYPGLEPEADGGTGNYALRDAMAALRWVHANASAFGGDPRQITIAGQSAGGALVYAILAHEETRGLASRAIIQSFVPGSVRLGDAVEANAVALDFAGRLGALSVEALRAASAESVLRASDHSHIDLHVDGATISDPLIATLTRVADVPIMIGVTADETSFLRPDLASHRRDAERLGPNFLSLYPASDDSGAADASLRANRDGNIVALSRWSATRTRTASAPTYLYLWRRTLPGPNAERYRAFHSSEVPYVFGSFAAAPHRQFDDDDRRVSEAMVEYWSNFVKTGDPNGHAVPLWPRADSTGAPFMELGDVFGPVPPLRSEVTAFYNEYYDSTGQYVF